MRSQTHTTRWGPSQHEIDLHLADAMKMADDCMTCRVAVREHALRYGLHATFMPKPLADENGSGMHTHQSLSSAGENALDDPRDRLQLSATARAFMAGQLRHAPEICSIFAQWVNSYKRLVPGSEAPVDAAWSRRNRSAMLRVQLVRSRDQARTQIELRCPDPACNPYLTFAVLLQAGLEGIEEAYELPDPMETNHLTSRPRSDATSESRSCPRRWGRRSSSPRSRSSCCEPWASTSSTATWRSSAKNGTTTGFRRLLGSSRVTCRCCERRQRVVRGGDRHDGRRLRLGGRKRSARAARGLRHGTRSKALPSSCQTLTQLLAKRSARSETSTSQRTRPGGRDLNPESDRQRRLTHRRDEWFAREAGLGPARAACSS